MQTLSARPSHRMPQSLLFSVNLYFHSLGSFLSSFMFGMSGGSGDPTMQPCWGQSVPHEVTSQRLLDVG